MDFPDGKEDGIEFPEESRIGRAISIKAVLIVLAGILVAGSAFAMAIVVMADNREQLTNRAFDIAKTALFHQQTLLSDILGEQKSKAQYALTSFHAICDQPDKGKQQECLATQLDRFVEDRPAKRAIITFDQQSVGWGENPEALLDYPALGELQVAYFNMGADEPSYIVEVITDESDDLFRVEYKMEDVLEYFSSRIPDTIDETWLVAPGGEWIYPRDNNPSLDPDFFTACLQGESGETTSAVGGTPMLMAYQNIPEIGGGCLNVSLSQKQALGNSGVFGSMFVGLVAVLIFGGSFMAVAVARHVTRPIDQLTERATQLMTGDVTAPVRVRGPREIRLFARAFGRMARQIVIKNQEIHEKADMLERALASRDKFLSYASHELNTPLTVLKLRLQVITQYRSNGQLDPKMLDRSLSSVENEVERLIRLVSILFDVTRAKLGKLSIEPTTCDLTEIVNNVVERFEGQSQQSHTKLAVDVPERLPGEWDCFRLEQVLFNLIGNAIKFGEGKPICVRVREIEDNIFLEVIDQGVGISRADQASIFNVYEQAGNGKGQGGMGLGLFISNEIVRCHGGRIEVESEVGQGTTFRVVLPYETAMSSGQH